MASRDAFGHGTTTTASACGSGRNSPNCKYRGIAPKASIISVKICSDGVAAQDDQPEELAFFKMEWIPIAIDFIRDKARDLKMPCVMVLNIGSQGGPTDGTSELCRKIASKVGPGKPGLIFVTGPGDDGGRVNRAGGKMRRDQALTLKSMKESKTSVLVDLWHSGDDDRLDVSVQTPGGKHGPFPSRAGDKERLCESDKEFAYYHNAGYSRFHGPTGSPAGRPTPTGGHGKLDAYATLELTRQK